ncbi:hypothetical protein DSO57_1013232 [Entomophthora muscae]|uniref:Uncharacterized protein n=1 Tax=Entomophthora muscae TaxID=34485 RepID=A0ACC2TUC4_9FUNG|nr:hypothetical protein DSO57_1013232 [Entomophthora muscae]
MGMTNSLQCCSKLNSHDFIHFPSQRPTLCEIRKQESSAASPAGTETEDSTDGMITVMGKNRQDKATVCPPLEV